MNKVVEESVLSGLLVSVLDAFVNEETDGEFEYHFPSVPVTDIEKTWEKMCGKPPKDMAKILKEFQDKPQVCALYDKENDKIELKDILFYTYELSDDGKKVLNLEATPENLENRNGILRVVIPKSANGLDGETFYVAINISSAFTGLNGIKNTVAGEPIYVNLAELFLGVVDDVTSEENRLKIGETLDKIVETGDIITKWDILERNLDGELYVELFPAKRMQEAYIDYTKGDDEE